MTRKAPRERDDEKGEETEYAWDVFVSYRRRDPVLSWLDNHFLPKLTMWLSQEISAPRVFRDVDLEVGRKWPAEIARAHGGSKVMLAILSPDYFRSPWCMSEWNAIRARESALGLFSKKETRGLVLPILYCGDASMFPGDAGKRQWIDMSRMNTPDDVFRQTPAYVTFDREMQRVSRALAKMISHAPELRAWPKLKAPHTIVRPRMAMPRLT